MIDYAKIIVKAGDGGNGRVSFHQDKFTRKGGPDGGSGGDGGSVYLEADKDLNTLKPFQYQKRFEAQNGQPGGKAKKTGGDGQDIVIKVPCGTVIKSQGETVDLTQPGQKILIARGGKAGRGNWWFRSPSRTTPRIAEKGAKGEQKELVLELKLLADVGLIGQPNSGKSTLLSVLTSARPKIADYPFTTLEPNLGVMTRTDLVIADIPGLIEGASQGKGLGHQFLRHVERCKVLVHLLDGLKLLTKGDLLADYQAVRNELSSYSKDLSAKSEIIVLNKIDLLSDRQIKTVLAGFKKMKKKIIPISAASHENLEELKRELLLFPY